MEKGNRIDVFAPLWDQSTFYGRFRHFAWMTNPLNTLHSKETLLDAKKLLGDYTLGQEPKGTSDARVCQEFMS